MVGPGSETSFPKWISHPLYVILYVLICSLAFNCGINAAAPHTGVDVVVPDAPVTQVVPSHSRIPIVVDKDQSDQGGWDIKGSKLEGSYVTLYVKNNSHQSAKGFGCVKQVSGDDVVLNKECGYPKDQPVDEGDLVEIPFVVDLDNRTTHMIAFAGRSTEK